jgi:HNH endonuclease
MDLPDQLDNKSVEIGIANYLSDSVEHSFIDSTKFDLIHLGKRLPPKAITALAVQHQTGYLPTPNNFSGGADSKSFLLLRNAGFRIVPKIGTIPFDVGSKYKRPRFAKYLGTDQDTTKGDWATGYHLHIDKEAGIEGWWFVFSSLGVAGRTGHDYSNNWLDKTTLHWQGKKSSQVGQPQIDALLSGNYPVLLFSRNDNRDPFTYHGLATPMKVNDVVPVEVDWKVDNAPDHDGEIKDFDGYIDGDIYKPSNVDHREKVMQEIRIRRGQQKFRQSLLKVHSNKCVITGCDIVGLLEAAHIRPYRGVDDNHPSNGLLVRCDIHTLFDLDLLGINPNTRQIHFKDSVRRPPYDSLEGIHLPHSLMLSYQALFYRWQQFVKC